LTGNASYVSLFAPPATLFMPFNWTCPHCNVKTTIVDSNFTKGQSTSTKESFDGYRVLEVEWIVCPNEECKRLALYVRMFDYPYNNVYGMHAKADKIETWRLIPSSNAKVFPTYIPAALIKDYQEASSIVQLSPKASATLARRCLQGIIRDFFKVSKSRLIDEIAAIEDKVDPLIWKAIDAVRKVGNIGAHMEKDINLIVDVDKDEASLLLGLIEMLFEELYIHRYEREEKLKQIIQLAQDKENEKKK
jgi:hypothetical protein